MTCVRVIGASVTAFRQLRALAPARVDIVDEPLAEPDWFIVATDEQRLATITSRALPPFRVVTVPGIAGSLDAVAADELRVALLRMGAIGAHRTEISPLGVRLAAFVVRRLTMSS
jgi:hypothetical protein